MTTGREPRCTNVLCGERCLCLSGRTADLGDNEWMTVTNIFSISILFYIRLNKNEKRLMLLMGGSHKGISVSLDENFHM